MSGENGHRVPVDRLAAGALPLPRSTRSRTVGTACSSRQRRGRRVVFLDDGLSAIKDNQGGDGDGAVGGVHRAGTAVRSRRGGF